MSLTPVQRAESLLTEAVMTLYAGFRDNDFPEHYIFTLARIKMVERLHVLRTQEDPNYRFHRAKTALPPTAPVPIDGEGYGQLIEIAHQKVAEAIDALWEEGAAFVEDYIKRSARNHMAACLRWLRAQESPEKRSALVAEVNRLRASVGYGPASWEEIVTPSHAPLESPPTRAHGWSLYGGLASKPRELNRSLIELARRLVAEGKRLLGEGK